MTRIKQNTSRIALIAMLCAAPVLGYAQDTTKPAANETTTTDSAADTAGQAMDNAAEATKDAAESTGQAIENAAESTGEAVENAADSAGQAMDSAADTAQGTAPVDSVTGDASATQMTGSVPGQIVLQDEDSVLASNLIGSNVYSAGGEDIGEIDDLIVGLDGMVEGVVIGVGGFLGLGEKSVAIEMASLSTSTDENGNIRLVTSATKADLEAATEFVSVEDQANARATPPVNPATPTESGTDPAATQ